MNMRSNHRPEEWMDEEWFDMLMYVTQKDGLHRSTAYDQRTTNNASKHLLRLPLSKTRH